MCVFMTGKCVSESARHHDTFLVRLSLGNTAELIDNRIDKLEQMY